MVKIQTISVHWSTKIKQLKVSSFEEKDTKITATDTHEIINLQGTKITPTDRKTI